VDRGGVGGKRGRVEEEGWEVDGDGGG